MARSVHVLDGPQARRSRRRGHLSASPHPGERLVGCCAQADPADGPGSAREADALFDQQVRPRRRCGPCRYGQPSSGWTAQGAGAARGCRADACARVERRRDVTRPSVRVSGDPAGLQEQTYTPERASPRTPPQAGRAASPRPACEAPTPRPRRSRSPSCRVGLRVSFVGRRVASSILPSPGGKQG